MWFQRLKEAKSVGNKGFFNRIDWASFWTATIISFVVYFFTLGPSVGLEDSGELATAGAYLGVPHPPGYPFWTLCSWIFCKVFSWVTYMGHPTPAWAISLFSAVAGALAAGFTAMLISRSAHDFVTADGEEASSSHANSILAFGGGVGGALTFALSPVEWSQSTIVEIYSLNAFFLMLVFLLSYRWMRKPTNRVLWVTAFVFGLGLTNYQVLLFAIVPLAILILVRDCDLFRDVLIYCLPVLMTFQILQIGQLNRASVYMQSDAIAKHVALTTVKSCPSGLVIGLGLVILVAALLFVAFSKRDAETREKGLLYGGLAGAFLILLSAVVFVHSETWEGVAADVAPLIQPSRYALIAAFLAGAVVFAALAALVTPDRLRNSPKAKTYLIASCVAVAIALVMALTVSPAGLDGYHGEAYRWGASTFKFIVMLVVLIVLAALTPKGLCFALPAAGLQLVVYILLYRGAMNGLTHPTSWWFWWPIAWNFVLLALAILTLPKGLSVAGAAFFTQLGVSFYAYMPIVSDLLNPPMNWGYPRTWEGFKHAIMRGQYEAIALPPIKTFGGWLTFLGGQLRHYVIDVIKQFTDLLIPFALVPFFAGLFCVPKERRKGFFHWMIAATACFLMMSIFLIVLANVKGDVQDGFIQKVKFISSHAMIALWIGYGLVFAAVAALRLVSPEGRKRVSVIFAGVTILVATAFPIIQNYTDDRLVFELGGSEQNGHTFGWQFGAYELNGAQAIREQISADEEPLPDPSWPPSMEPFSLFFGGTDPGRFVPTYMIYAANYRPDIYLITQNALADDTYMSVERDLYGDELWIPSKEECGDAFSIYVDEVQRGVRQANGELVQQNGRIQVTGALGVMEINGILARMMYDHEKDNRGIYVEESYVIPWMYNFLSPHGLIMKLEPRPTRYQAEQAQKDADFWDWYVKRLTEDPAYRRDFAAQKSFSKLRAALAGLYLKKGRPQVSAQAYREAMLLYPASPESTFRYVQEILIPQGEISKVYDILDYTDKVDPHNTRTRAIRNFYNQVKRYNETYKELRLKTNRSPEESILLAEVAFNLSKSPQEVYSYISPFVGTVTDKEQLRHMAEILKAIGRDGDLERVLWKLLKGLSLEESKRSLNLYFDLARVQGRLKKVREGMEVLSLAYRLDKDRTLDVLSKDEELIQLQQNFQNQKGTQYLRR